MVSISSQTAASAGPKKSAVPENEPRFDRLMHRLPRELQQEVFENVVQSCINGCKAHEQLETSLSAFSAIFPDLDKDPALRRAASQSDARVEYHNISAGELLRIQTMHEFAMEDYALWEDDPNTLDVQELYHLGAGIDDLSETHEAFAIEAELCKLSCLECVDGASTDMTKRMAILDTERKVLGENWAGRESACRPREDHLGVALDEVDLEWFFRWRASRPTWENFVELLQKETHEINEKAAKNSVLRDLFGHPET